MSRCGLLLLTLLALLALCPAIGAAAPPQKVILDTDIGDDIDDAYALAMLTALPEAKLLGVTTTFHNTDERARLAAKLLRVLGRSDVPVYAGRPVGTGVGRQSEWAKGFEARSIHTGAVDFLKEQIERAPGQVTLIGIGALTNMGDLLTRYPEVAPKIQRIVIMGGSVYVGYNYQAPPAVEWNIRCDPAAARAVYNSGVPLTMAGLEVTAMMQLDAERQKRLFAAGRPDTDALAALTALWGGGTPTLYDPVAVAYALGHAFCEGERQHVEVSDDGMTRITPGTPNVTVLVKPRKEAFLDWYVQTVSNARR